MSMPVQEHVVRLYVAVDEPPGMDGIQCHDHLSCVELGPLLRDAVGAGEVHQVPTRHVLHHHVQVAVVLEGTAQLHPNGEESGILSFLVLGVSCHKILKLYHANLQYAIKLSCVLSLRHIFHKLSFLLY